MAKRSLPSWDDGRVVAPMNVEGMPWYREEKPVEQQKPAGQPLSGRETRWMIFGSLKAALLIAGVFSLMIVAFVGLLLLAWT